MARAPHVALIAPPLSGHLNPMLALGQALITRGVSATYFGAIETRAKVRAAGLGFVSVGAATHGVGDAARRAAILARADALTGLRAVIDQMARDTAMLVAELPDAFAAAHVTAVICDQLEPAGALVAQHLRLPYASLASALPINRAAETPPYFTGWLPDTSLASPRVIAGAEQVYDLMTRAHGRVIAETAEAWGLPPQRTCQDTLSADLDLWQIPQAYDFPRSGVGAQVRYVGPIRADDAAEPVIADDRAITDAIARARTKPIVFASFGTLFGARIASLRGIATAAKRIGLQAVIADGGRLSEDARGALQETGAIVRTFVAQRALLDVARVCVTHGGMNTTMDALEAGVPLIACPIGFDQKANAARVVWHGAGISLPPTRRSARAMTTALEAVLSDRSYRSAAGRLSNAIRATGGRELAADMAVSALRLSTNAPAE
ncbi:MAG: glycosyltransferase [Pseudomonadota bacterium]